VIGGGDDSMVSFADGGVVHRLVPDVWLHVVRGGGDLFLLGWSAGIAAFVVDFLTAA